tara:strand:+ start:940 stop:1743 length:804 start_codon:yes stop_codon:yes gene_type:complete
MAKEEVLEAVVEEPTNTEGTEEELSPWYVFCSTGCGFCKKAEPVVEELNNEGYDILTLDMSEPDNAKLNQELKDEYKTQCGTPWFINAETGKGICGYREKAIVKKWLDGEDIPEPPRPTGAPPKTPFYGSTNKENIDWKKGYNKWVRDNKHMPKDWQDRQKSANELIDGPRAKSDPPRPPMGPQTTDKQFDDWGEQMKDWQEQNKHLPNLQPVDNMIQGMKQRRDQMAQGGPGVPGGPGGAVSPQLEGRLSSLESKVDRLITHLGVK